ncbi:MAG: hypothetical protein JKY02_11190 [Flavobacteriaceae bacterium]|nr:hypothetical protein [Flavobacteriaceae bacterium]
MKKIITTLVLGLFIIGNTYAQSTPKPPKTPSTGTSYSISFDYDDDKSSNSSVSIKKNENVYKLSARFGKHRTEEIRRIVLKKLRRSGLTVSGKTYTWIKHNQGEEVFECKLSQGRLRLFVDKEYASERMIETMSAFGAVLKDAISGSDSKKEAEKDVKRAKKDLKRAKDALKKALREVEKLEEKTKGES